MDTALDIGRIVFGGVILYLGAEWLVKGSAGLARAFGVTPLVVGLTVVAYGTSAPELAVSTKAILNNSSELVLGNIIGSCIANLALILGLTAVIAPPAVDSHLIRREVPVLAASAIAVPIVLWDGQISFVEAAVLLACAIAFTIITLGAARTVGPAASDADADADASESDADSPAMSRWRLVGLSALGLVLLIGGGDVFVEGAQGVALTLGMSEQLVGLTVVAVGTSLPELAASVVAALRGFSGLAVGNVVGSNIFNVFLVLGAVGLIRTVERDIHLLGFELIFLGAVTAFAVLSMRGTRRITRAEGLLLLTAYAVFIGVIATREMA